MELMREVLQKIKSGKMHFQPHSTSAEALQEFQPIAQRIESAARRGWIHDAKIERSRARATYNLAKQVIAVGPLTLEGEKFLAETQSPSVAPQAIPKEIFQLKPSIYGLGVDLKAAYSWVRRKVKK